MDGNGIIERYNIRVAELGYLCTHTKESISVLRPYNPYAGALFGGVQPLHLVRFLS